VDQSSGYTLDPKPVSQLVALELAAEATEMEHHGHAVEAYNVMPTGDAAPTHGQPAEIFYCPHTRKAGVAWESHTEWDEADSAQDALHRFTSRHSS
jgi:hypothetical protein